MFCVRNYFTYKGVEMFQHILHTNMCSVQTYVTYENGICSNLCFEQKYDVLCLILCYIRKCVMSEYMLHTNMKYVLSELMVHTKHFMSELMLHSKIWFISPKWFYIRQCHMSEPMLPTKIWCLVSELMLHTKMCNVRTYATHEFEMYSNRTYFTLRNVKCPNVQCTCMLHTSMMSCIRTYVTYVNEYNVRTQVTHENRMTRERIFVAYKMCNVRTHVLHKYEICSVRTNVTYENV